MSVTSTYFQRHFSECQDVALRNNRLDITSRGRSRVALVATEYIDALERRAGRVVMAAHEVPEDLSALILSDDAIPQAARDLNHLLENAEPDPRFASDD